MNYLEKLAVGTCQDLEHEGTCCVAEAQVQTRGGNSPLNSASKAHEAIGTPEQPQKGERFFPDPVLVTFVNKLPFILLQ